MSSYRLSRRAEQDLHAIFLFGYEQFGARQAEAYAKGLEETFQLLADNPYMGREAESIAPGVRRHEREAHTILYELAPDGGRILAIVHERSVRRLAL